MTDHTFTAEELERLATLLAEKVAAKMPPHTCPFTADEVIEVRNIARRAVLIRETVMGRIIDVLSYGVIALVVLGIIKWIREQIAQ